MRTNSIRALTLTALFAAPSLRPVMAEQLPGEYAIRTVLKNTYLTARPGNHSIDAVITSGTIPGPHERFRFERQAGGYTLIKTSGGYLLSAAGAGGRGGESDAGQTLQTERTSVADDARFKLFYWGPPYGGYTIQTLRNYYLTALGGGGKSTSAFHTDATKASGWESYWVNKCGDLGSGYDYAVISKANSYALTAIGGGVKNVVTAKTGSGTGAAMKLKLIRQPSTGWYALQTSNGINYVTAIKGGGLTKGTASWDNLVTDRTRVQAWETFAIREQGSCTYTIQTSNGSYIGVNQGGTSISTAIPNPATGANQGYNVYFELRPFI